MKKFKFILMCMLAMLTGFSACSSSDDNDGKQMTNYVSISAAGNNIINEDDDEEVKFNILIGNTLTADATISLSLEGNDDNVATLTPSTVALKAGAKTASFTVKSNKKSLLKSDRVLTVKATFSDANMKTDGKAATLTIKPDSDIPVLTAEQQKLIEGYKQNLNIDLTKILGKVKVDTKVTFNDDDKIDINDNKDTRSFSGVTIITLSEKATADKPVLKMVSNAMGMAAFNYEMLRKRTVEDAENWTQMPYGKAVMENINYNYNKETFTMTLDGIEVNPADMSLKFTGSKVTMYEEKITTVPFDYTFSAWDRLKAKADANESFVVDEGETKTKVSVQDIIDGGGSLNPYSFFDNTDVVADGEETDYTTIYVAPTGKIDFTSGKMTFAFPWYLDNTYGCQRVEATYTFGN
ncbi:DUF4929 family protein [Segatella copri]|uniref:DUF4929 family protein n=1 Tax=Segatella copri TaxID=165179 RepID=UPI0025CC440F|nr:DUF4929 family protein [Segatella copri]MDV3105982.1 DUF4929 family protein [Segatella copri]MDV3112727.1 DUF4929 family protein [Segatella copri]